MESELCRPGLGAQQTPLGFWGAVDLIVDVFAGVHVETRVEEGAVTEALVRVLVDDATEKDKKFHTLLCVILQNSSFRFELE